MPLESATYISDLNTSNPVGSTDKVQTLDDHVRLLKSTLKTTFPNVTGAMTASHTELNILDGATLSTAELNILDGVTLTASQINDAALKSASNTFSGQIQTFTHASGGRLRVVDSSDNRGWEFFADATSGGIHARLADGTFVATPITMDCNGVAVTSLALAATAITLNGVNVTDYARLSQPAAFQSTLSTAGAATLASLSVTGAATVGSTLGVTGAATLSSTLAVTGATTLTGALTAATIANSDSETLVAGQLHFIDANATLPNLAAGQWIQVVNDSASSITISKNASDTTYWSLTGASVSTSFTLAARGVLTARCNPAGSAVYVTGSGITAAS